MSLAHVNRNMSTPENKTGLPLVHLGITRPEELAPLFADLRGRFDEECACAHDDSSWKQFRDAWLGRKSGVLTQITDNWLKPATQELKRVVGQELNQLRAHTSPMQIRTMEKRQPPVRVIVPGKVYRRDNPDATHSFIFHQVEGLAVDNDITFCDFTGTIEYFVKQFFGPGVKTRFRPSYFPFTEPSVEFDVSCIFCGGSGTAAGGGTCSKCNGSGWIELFGAGMVDPAVYGFVKYDPKKVSGFAFRIGIYPRALLKYGIDDIQVFFQNDVRFLRQFP